MPQAVAEDQFLKVHTARDGSIWYIEGAKRPARSTLGVHDFPDGPEVSRFRRVRMLGTWDNAPLIARFYAFKTRHQIASIAVASPMLGRTVGERGDPNLMLTRMRAFPWPPSLGGYHEVTPLDYTAYLLATYFRFDLATREHVDYATRGHPLWRYLSFIPHLDPMSVALLVATVLDPRWYARWDEDVDEYNPRDYVNAQAKDAARLNQYLGLDPSTMADARLGRDGGHAARAKVALAAWKTTDAPPPGTDDDPRYFLWRRWRTYDSADKANLRVTQLFVDFVRLCWLDAIYMAGINRGPQGRPDGLFAPDHSFRPDEAAAFRCHMQRR